ncbi:cob(I)yrinic acid a,c-diamide adenosyltransferase [Candidatus Dojkabacteria bacterium]|uniref:Corrinoid adenosyltransferase n=1 Tax=Candidatus Dojkabacteria bacterium TaxID=2099670 RepID=A0A3M0YYS7_9BACT|nr:MAG: cob(I)yrinic acid a,c-diamide adenosyltransferase [Candidatus Dojkabacteria bacterium]
MSQKIYTRTGDHGETSLIGKRISKDAEVLDVIGKLDELNSYLGLVCEFLTLESEIFVKDIIRFYQGMIFSISSVLAGADNTTNLDPVVVRMEQEIDNWDKLIPKLENFIIPGGTVVSAHIHVARSICRSCERSFVRYINKTENQPENCESIKKFLNRLSDWMFTLARLVNYNRGVSDTIWQPNPDAIKLI